jgi:uncharacterized protein YndB with AHSA1/START domain
MSTTAPITVTAFVPAALADVWKAYTTPRDIMNWNAASDDWHTTAATVDLRTGGQFSSRMEAKDGSMGFDFAGTYTSVTPMSQIDSRFGDRTSTVTFVPERDGVRVTVTFDPEYANPRDMQEAGWQAILNSFARYLS